VKNEDSKKHRGEYLNRIVRKKGVKISSLTKEAGFDRSTFYNHVKDPVLPYSILAKYGKVINYDFSREEHEQYVRNSDSPDIASFDDMKKDRDNWRDKYFEVSELLHKYLKNKDK